MRVTYFIDSLASGGAQRQAVELAVSLARRGKIDAHFLVYHPDDFYGPRLAEHGVRVELVERTSARDPRFPARLRQRILAGDPDVVHAFMWSKAAWPALAMVGLGKRRPVFVASERNSEVASTTMMKWLQRFAYGNADAVTANCKDVAGELVTQLGLTPAKVHYLPNGLDLGRWDENAGDQVPQEFSPDEIPLAVVGRIEPQKNHPLLIEAVAGLPKELRSRISLWFLGRRPNSPWTGALDAQIAAAGLTEQVHFLGAVVNVSAWVRRMRALVLPSRHEGFPNVVMEAMATRTPVIVTDVGDVRNIVEPGCGEIVPSDNPVALAAAIARICELPDDAHRALGERGREIVEQRFQIDKVADNYLALYREAIG